MAKSKVCIAVALCVLSFFIVLSCAKPRYVLRISYAESGRYEVDVAKWLFYKGSVDTGWIYTVKNADAVATALYMQPGDGMAHMSGPYMLLLQKYEVTWPAGSGIPRTSGALSTLVESDLDGKKTIDFDFMVIPGVNKDTVGVLAALRSDPENNDFLTDQLTAKAKVKFTGKDLVTDEEISTESEMTVVFADYLDPNNAH
jgi:hypothetical protein